MFNYSPPCVVGLHGRMILQLNHETNKKFLNKNNFHINLNQTLGYILNAVMHCNTEVTYTENKVYLLT